MMTVPLRRFFGWLALFLGVIATVGSGCRKGESSPAESSVKMRVAMDLWPGYFPVLIGQERGFFKTRGLELEVTFPEDTHGMLADFAGGRYDGVFASVGDLILATRQSPGSRFVLCTDESAEADQIIGVQTFGSAASLRGARIGTTLGGYGELLVRHFLLSHGLTAKDVTIVNADGADVPKLLEGRQLDVGHTWEPYASRARATGHALLYTSAQTPGLVLDGLIVRQAFLDERPKELRRFADAWFEALEWWSSHPQEGNQIIRQYLEKKGITPGLVTPDGIRLKDRAANRALFKGGAEGLHASVAEYIDFFVAKGSLPHPLTPDEILDGSFIE